MYLAKEDRYEHMNYFRCGNSGLKLPAVSLGLWHNFGSKDNYDNMKQLVFTAFDNGITHFDLANNYGPVYGSAEENFGRIMESEMRPYRNQMVISTKAGYDMWPGPYGDGGSRKYLISSLDESLKRMKVDYVDIFYHHRPDPETPLEETMGTLADIVRQGKALYVGLSNYSRQEAEKAVLLLKDMGIHCLIEQPRYNMFERTPEDGLFKAMWEHGVGCICYSPLAQGALTDKYLNGIPQGSRASRVGSTINDRYLSEEKLDQIRRLSEIASGRNQSLAQMALAWVLREKAVTSVLIGASSVKQLENSVHCLDNLEFSAEELKTIDEILK